MRNHFTHLDAYIFAAITVGLVYFFVDFASALLCFGAWCVAFSLTVWRDK